MVELKPEHVERFLRGLHIIDGEAKMIQEDPRTPSIAAHKAKNIRRNVIELKELLDIETSDETESHVHENSQSPTA